MSGLTLIKGDIIFAVVCKVDLFCMKSELIVEHGVRYAEEGRSCCAGHIKHLDNSVLKSSRQNPLWLPLQIRKRYSPMDGRHD